MLAHLLLLTLSSLTAAVYGYSNPEACSGTCTNTHDPSIVRRSDGTYFRFSTGGLIPIHTAPAISGPWTFRCEMLTGNARLTVGSNAGTDLWAPDVSLVDGTYYVYYSVSSFGTQNSAIGLATSRDMSCGSFSDRGGIGIASSSSKPYNAIDANLLNDGGVYRMQFGSFWRDIFQVTMNSVPTRPSGSSVQLSYDPAGTSPEEGAFLIKNGNYYYLFFSWGICCGYDANRPASGQEYRIKVCRSRSATGGFVCCPPKNPLTPMIQADTCTGRRKWNGLSQRWRHCRTGITRQCLWARWTERLQRPRAWMDSGVPLCRYHDWIC